MLPRRIRLIGVIAAFTIVLTSCRGNEAQSPQSTAKGTSQAGCRIQNAEQCYKLALAYAVDTIRAIRTGENKRDTVSRLQAAKQAVSDYLRKACDGKFPQGCTSLGDTYMLGLASTADSAKTADSLFRLACSLKDATGCNNLGDAFSFGIGVRESEDSAVHFFRIGCDSLTPPNLTACHRLGARIRDGKGVARPDTTLAIKYFERACNESDTAGQSSGMGWVSLAFQLMQSVEAHKQHDRGDTITAQRAYRLYSISCRRGTALACNNLGAMLNAHYPGISTDSVRAATLFRQSCENGEGFSCRNVGAAILARRASRSDSSRALDFYRQGCDYADKESCTSHGLLALALKRDKDALISYQYACALESGNGCNNLGILYAQNYRGADPDLYYYKRACFTLGNARGCSNLANELIKRGRMKDAAAARARACAIDKTDCQ
jgi:TPR repeat protein